MADTLGQVSYASTRNPFNYDKFEQISRDTTTAWLTTTEIDNQLNLFGDTSQNTYLAGLEVAVRMAIEDYLGMSIFAQSYRVYYGIDSLYSTPVCLDLPEISQGSTLTNGVTIDSVKYYDGNSPSVLQTLTSGSSNYYYDVTGNKVILVNGVPSNISQNRTSPIIVEYTLAANALASYPVIKQAGLLMLTHLYNNRSETVSGGLQRIPYGVDALLRPYKPLVM
jgi:hypothetical protein